MKSYQWILLCSIIPIVACQQSNSTIVEPKQEILSPPPQMLSIENSVHSESNMSSTNQQVLHADKANEKTNQLTEVTKASDSVPNKQVSISTLEEKHKTSSQQAPGKDNIQKVALNQSTIDACNIFEPDEPESTKNTFAIITRGLMRNADFNNPTHKIVHFTGIGRANNKRLADQGALEELRNNINDAVTNNQEACSSTAKALLSVCQKTQYSILSQDELPLLGVQYIRQQEAQGNITSAEINATVSLKEYQAQIKAEHHSLLQLLDKFQQNKTPNATEKRQLGVHLRRYLGLATVAAVLGETQYSKNSEEFKPILKHISAYQIAKSLDEAATMIMAAVPTSNIHVFPARQYNALEVTPFGAELAKHLTQKLKSKKLNSKSFNNAMPKHTLVGNYRICNNGDMLLNYDLIGKTYLVADTISLRIAKNVYAKYRAQPISENFDQVFMQKTAAQEGFRSDITTNHGKQNLLFRDSELVNFYARLSQPGYFFIVGHVMIPGENNFSYLLELDEDPGNEKFIFQVSPENINQYIDLGEYEMGAPFGNEYLQLVASSKPPELPNTRWNKEMELDILDDSTNSLEKSVERVRAARKVKKSKHIKIHESLLSYTTMQ